MRLLTDTRSRAGQGTGVYSFLVCLGLEAEIQIRFLLYGTNACPKHLLKSAPALVPSITGQELLTLYFNSSVSRIPLSQEGTQG